MLRTISQTVLPFKLEKGNRDDEVTGLAGLPLVCEFIKRIGLKKQIRKHLRIKGSGWSEYELIEAIIMLVIAGGEHLEDIRMLSSDRALQQLIGKKKQQFVKAATEEEAKNAMGAFPSAKALERFLKLFHDSEYRHPGVGSAWVPKETKALEGLGEINRWFVRRMIAQRGLKRVTLENDATAVESHKKDLLGMYKGGCGYMPVNGVIAELGTVAADEFRDGNVTPSYDVLNFFKETLQVLPQSVEEVCARLDGAYYNHDLIKFMRKRKIQFTITGKLSPSIVEWIRSLPESDWKPLKKITERGEEDTNREWTEMSWTSALGSQADMRRRTLRTIITRKKAYQWEMFQNEHAEAAEKDRYEVIETNRDWAGDRLIRWHYERGGSIEHVHDHVKNDLAGHVLPCAEFGANAAWWRLQCLAWNIVRAIQLNILPEEFRECHMKRLRFNLFCIAGRVIRHARNIILRLANGHPSFEMYRDARIKIASLAFS